MVPRRSASGEADQSCSPTYLPMPPKPGRAVFGSKEHAPFHTQ
jgi:hypothetical protein